MNRYINRDIMDQILKLLRKRPWGLSIRTSYVLQHLTRILKPTQFFPSAGVRPLRSPCGWPPWRWIDAAISLSAQPNIPTVGWHLRPNCCPDSAPFISSLAPNPAMTAISLVGFQLVTGNAHHILGDVMTHRRMFQLGGNLPDSNKNRVNMEKATTETSDKTVAKETISRCCSSRGSRWTAHHPTPWPGNRWRKKPQLP